MKIQDVHVHGASGLTGTCTFKKVPGRYPFILSVPQQVTISLLEDNLQKFPNVSILRRAEAKAVSQQQDHVTLEAAGRRVRAAFVVACDGWRSGLRRALRIRTRERQYGCHFTMGDFVDRSTLAEEAQLFFTPDGAVESFPLPGGIRRWIVQTPSALHGDGRFIRDTVQQRTGVHLALEDQLNQSAFTPQRMDCEVLYDHRVILCGDAAHVMSPIGGQGMNVGFADAAQLAPILPRMIHIDEPVLPLLEAYQKERQGAARQAARHATQGMWLVTRTGVLSSWLRDAIIGKFLLKPPFADWVAKRFAMLDETNDSPPPGRPSP